MEKAGHLQQRALGIKTPSVEYQTTKERSEGMLQVSQIESIRNLAEDGMSCRKIAENLKIDRKTVSKYLERTDFNVTVKHRESISKLDPYKAEIRALIDKEDGRFHKQRWTATRMWEYLWRDKGYGELEHSYHQIRRYMKRYRLEKNREESAPGTMPLVWHPAEAQCDFGEADFRIKGDLRRLPYMILSFPYSNRMLCAVLPGENCECVCQGLRYFFEFLGGAPVRIVFDNATGIGKRVWGRMKESELFVRFRLQYGFKSSFCNARSGWEKGSVESCVGAFRRNRMVPEMSVEGDIAEWDVKKLIPLSFAFRARQTHYRKGETVERLFEEDRKALLPLPAKPFEVVRIDGYKLNHEGSVLLDGSHRYTLGSRHADEEVIVAKRAWTICFHDAKGTLITEFPRQYGGRKTEDYDLEAILRTLCRKPNAWPNSPVRDAMEAGGFRDYIDSVDGKERSHALYLLGQEAERHGFPLAFYACNKLCRDGKVPQSYDVDVLCDRITSFPLGRSENPTGTDLSRFDALMRKEGGMNHEAL